MIHKNGLLPATTKRRNSFERTFGAVSPLVLPAEYNADNGVTMPNQGTTQLCTAELVTDLCSDSDEGTEYSVGWQMAKTLQLMGGFPGGQGASITKAFDVAVLRGLLPKRYEPFTWQEKGELYASDWKHYDLKLNDIARDYRRPEKFVVDGPYDHFDNIRSALWVGRFEKRTVGMGTQWFREFSLVGKDGIVKKSFSAMVAWHATKVSGWKVINGETYLMVKSWQGSEYGDNGWVYFSREITNKLLSASGAIALTLKDSEPDQIVKQRPTLKNLYGDLYERIWYLLETLLLKKA